MGYKNVCTNCRISLSEGTNYELFNTNKTCPICNGKMYFVNEKFKAPKKSNDKEWTIIEYLLLSGVNDTLRMYKNDDIRMYNFNCITDTIVEVITTCNTYTLLTVHLL